MKKIYGIIRKLGVTSKYKGYFFVADAIELAMNSQGKPILITKDIYPYLARKYKTTPMNIEHNIRTVINVCWETNKAGMDEIAGYPLTSKPTNSEFIDMIAYNLLEEQS
ncbi:MAG: sporulation initiation factor Spo0A C-terminal domain-containing protein [Oliverpabstia sp.]